MADEATDLRKRTILSVCLRYLGKNGQPIEYFAGLTELNHTDAATVTDGILLILERANINPNMVMWLSFDGASNMSGKNAGTQALMINNHTKLAVYIHCRSHALQLVCVNAAQQFSDIKKIFSVLNSLWRVLYNSPKKLRQFKAIQEILEDPDIELYRAGETRWISHYRCISAK